MVIEYDCGFSYTVRNGKDTTDCQQFKRQFGFGHITGIRFSKSQSHADNSQYTFIFQIHLITDTQQYKKDRHAVGLIQARETLLMEGNASHAIT